MNILRQYVVVTATTANIVSGSAFEYPQQPSQVSIAVNASVATNFCTIYAGARLIAEEFPMTVAASYPIVPDSFYFNFIILPGERLVVNNRNGNAGSNTNYLVIDMQPIAR